MKQEKVNHSNMCLLEMILNTLILGMIILGVICAPSFLYILFN